MPILEAVFRKGEVEEPIFIDTIETHPEFTDVKNNIYCTFESCEAKLEYVPKGKNIAHFKTWPRQDHTPECLDYFEREKRAKSQRNSATVTMALSDKHIANILNDIKRRRRTQANEGSEENRTKKRQRKNPEIDSALPANSGLNINPTTGADADVREGEVTAKAPSVRRRNLLLLNENDIGFTRSLSDVVINDIQIEEERVILTVCSSKGNKTCNVYFEEFFFSSAPVNFIERFKALKKIVGIDNGLYFSCVGQVIQRNDQIHIIVNKHSDFRVEDLYLTLFIDNYLHGR